MKRIYIVLTFLSIVSLAFAKDWDGIPVPAAAESGKVWELQEGPSDDFNYTFNATNAKTNFGSNKWYNFFHNTWNGPGTTYWQYDHISVDGSKLVLRSSRNPSTSKMNVPGVNTGCVTSNNKVVYPVFVEASVSVANIALASDVWMLSPDDTQEIDIIECYGGAPGFSNSIHLSHHSFVRSPFKDYQPGDTGSWWKRSGVDSWGQYCWNNGERQYVRVAVNWIGPKHFEYYIDGELVRVLYDKAVANKLNGIWYYYYPTLTNGVITKTASGYQALTLHSSSSEYLLQSLIDASNVSTTSIIDPYSYQGTGGISKPMDIIINVESQDWHVTAGRVPSDADLLDPSKNTMTVDWIRVYKPVSGGNSVTHMNAKQLVVYPNPFENNIQVSGDALLKSYVVCGITGVPVLLGDIDNTTATINTSSLSAGIYILKVQQEDGVWLTKKINKL